MPTKETKRKLRRYSFQAKMVLTNGQSHAHKLPGIVLGSHAEACAISQRMLEQFKSNPNAPDVEVEAVGHETVSFETVQTFEALNRQLGIVSKAMYILAERIRLGIDPNASLDNIVDVAVKEAEKHLNPAMRDALENMPDHVNAMKHEAQEKAESTRTKRKIGIEAVREILDNPPEQE